MLLLYAQLKRTAVMLGSKVQHNLAHASADTIGFVTRQAAILSGSIPMGSPLMHDAAYVCRPALMLMPSVRSWPS